MNVFEWGKAIVVDDYAHHPTEIRKVLETLKGSFPNQKNCVIFQPHLFSRTQDFMKDFLSVLAAFDEVFLLEIYPAREAPIPGINSSQFCVNILLTKVVSKKRGDWKNSTSIFSASRA